MPDPALNRPAQPDDIAEYLERERAAAAREESARRRRAARRVARVLCTIANIGLIGIGIASFGLACADADAGHWAQARQWAGIGSLSLLTVGSLWRISR